MQESIVRAVVAMPLYEFQAALAVSGLHIFESQSDACCHWPERFDVLDPPSPSYVQVVSFAVSVLTSNVHTVEGSINKREEPQVGRNEVSLNLAD